MGVFDFVKDAGAAIGIGKSSKEEEAAKAAKAKAEADLKEAQRKRAEAARAHAAAAKKAAQAETREAKAKERREAAAAREAAAEAKMTEKLTAHVAGLGLRGRKLAIRFDDGTAHVSGTVANQATKEKIILAVGNVEGVERVRETLRVTPQKKPAANTAAARARRKEAGKAQTMHTVKSGDTLSKLAKQYLGDANRYPEIFKANQPMLTDPNLILVGQVLRIPKK